MIAGLQAQGISHYFLHLSATRAPKIPTQKHSDISGIKENYEAENSEEKERQYYGYK